MSSALSLSCQSAAENFKGGAGSGLPDVLALLPRARKGGTGTVLEGRVCSELDSSCLRV